ncbi:hypothetical protein XELAEV_18002228mg, partial [Xenopus laevis]
AIVHRRFVFLIGTTLVSIAILVTRIWITSQEIRHQPRTQHLDLTLSAFRDSANLSDGLYTYHLNMSQFQSDFPYLQTYKCSVTLTPQKEQMLGNPKPVLIMAIKSHPRSGARRSAVRQTWAREVEVEGYWVKPIFLIAHTEVSGQMKLVALESRDDDEYVNPKAIVHYIKEHGSSPNTLHGNLQCHSAVMRSSKYAISKTVYPLHKYPNFLSGGGFLFPGTSVKYLHEAAQKIPVFPLDDVYFGFLALAANLTYRHDRRFYVWGLAFNASKYQEALVVHGIGPELLIKIWTKVQSAQCKEGQGCW